MQDKNILTVSGIIKNIEKSHDFRGEQFFRIILSVARLSDAIDLLPVIISEKLLYNNEIKEEMFVTITGQVRTKNHKENDKNRLLVFGYASDLNEIKASEIEALEIRNEVEIEGYICKPPTYREVSAGRIIADLLVACNRQYSKSDYIPCIAWGINAKMAKNLRVGDKIHLSGRFQSREYYRKNDNTEQANIAYEISIASLEVIDEKTEAAAIEENKSA